MKHDINYPSSDGKTQIHAIIWEPEDTPKAILQICHGMVDYADRYNDFAQHAADQGYYVVANDNLRHGASVVTDDQHGYFGHPNGNECVIADIHTLRTMTQKKYPDLPYFFLGHSMGSYMLRKYLCLHGENLSGAVIMGTGCVPDGTMKFGMTLCKFLAFFRGWNYRSKLVQKLSYSKPYHKFDLYGKDYTNSWLTKDVEHVKKYYSDPRCTFLFTLNGYYGLMEAVYFDNQMDNIKKVPKDLPVFMVSGADDPVGDLGEGVKKVYHMYKDAGVDDLTYRLYETDRHEILNETDRDQVYADICAWMSVRIAQI